MADRQRRRLAVLERHLEPEFANSFSGALVSSTCAAIPGPLMFNSLSATTLNTLNAKANSVECLPLNSLSAETLNSENAAATTSLSSLTFNSLSAETLTTSSCRTIPVVDRCQGLVPRFDKLLVADGRGHACHMVGQQKSSEMCLQGVDKMGPVNKVVPELGGNETKVLLYNSEDGQEEHMACLDDQLPNFYIQHIP